MKIAAKWFLFSALAAVFACPGLAERKADSAGDGSGLKTLDGDIVLSYSTYLGGSVSQDWAYGIALDSDGCAYVAGDTASDNFPTANAFQGAYSGDYDAFVAKLSARGNSLEYSTFLGGTGEDRAYGIAVDSDGRASVAGKTLSEDFPTTAGAYQPAYGGGNGDAFVARLTAAGDGLSYSTYLGGDESDLGTAVALDPDGGACVTGATGGNFPVTTGAFQESYGGSFDAFAAKLSAAGDALVYSTYLGGSSQDWGEGIAVDSSGAAYVAGFTDSVNFPTVNACQPAYGGNTDGFAVKLSSAGDALAYSTYLGGSSWDAPGAIALAPDGCACVTGFTWSGDFPTHNPFQAANRGQRDAFVTKLSSGGDALAYSTYLGGAGYDSSDAVALDGDNRVYVAGTTRSADFPTADPIQDSYPGGTDSGFVAGLTAAGDALVYSTYLGGTGRDEAHGIAVNPDDGSAYVAGVTFSGDFPVVGAWQDTYAGNGDAFVTMISGAPFAPTPTPPTTASPTPTAAATATPTPAPLGLKWAQPPNCTDGFNIPSYRYPGILPEVVADDFPCNDPRPIVRIRWWGSFQNWMTTEPVWEALPPDLPASFLISWHTYTHPEGEFSRPDELILEEPCFPTVIGHECSHPVWNNPTVFEHEYFFECDLPTPFAQVEGNYYFVNIVADYPVSPTYPWGWKNSEHHWNDDAVRWSGSGPWVELVWPEGHRLEGQSMDMAFELYVLATPSPIPTASPVPTASPAKTATPAPTLIPVKTPTPVSSGPAVIGDYDGDGTSDIALFRPSSGLWLVRGLTRAYFGSSTDEVVPRDYTGDGAWNVAVYRPSLGKWMVRGVTSLFYGVSTDLTVPADYDGDGSADIALFRPGIGKWLIRGGLQVYYGFASDTTVPGDYDGDGTTDIAVFRPSIGKWLVRNGAQVFYGNAADTVVPGDYTGDGSCDFAVFRPSAGRWLVKDGPNAYWGTSADTVQPGDYDGDGTLNFGVFRSSVGRWLIRGVTSAYYGASSDLPVTNP